MSGGTVMPVNRAMIQPIMIAGVEKKLALANALLSFPLVAATHFHFPACVLGLVFFIMVHTVLRLVSKHDPELGKLFKRSTRYSKKPYFPATSHPLMFDLWPIKSVSRPQ